MPPERRRALKRIRSLRDKVAAGHERIARMLAEARRDVAEVRGVVQEMTAELAALEAQWQPRSCERRWA